MNRLYYALIHPSRIALFIKDKLYVSIIYLIAFIILSVSPLIIKHSNSRYYFTNSEINYLVNQIPNESNGVFSSNTFSIDTPFSVTDEDDVIYNFDTTNTLKISSSNIVFVFSSTSIIVYQNGTRIMNTSYSNIKIDDFSFDLVSTDSTHYYSFKNLFETIYNSYFKANNISFTSEVIEEAIFTYLIILILLYIVTGLKNPYLRRSERFNLIVYSMTYSFICIFLSNYFSIEFFKYLGAFISTYCLVKALSSIKIIKIPKGE